MNKRNDAQPSIREEERVPEHPVRPESDTLEGPGGRQAKQEEEDAKSSATRTGER